MTSPESIVRQGLASYTSEQLVELQRRRHNSAAYRDVRDIRGVIEAAESVDMDVRTGVIGNGTIAAARQAHANGVAEALQWVLGAEPAADLERLIEGTD